MDIPSEYGYGVLYTGEKRKWPGLIEGYVSKRLIKCEKFDEIVHFWLEENKAKQTIKRGTATNKPTKPQRNWSWLEFGQFTFGQQCSSPGQQSPIGQLNHYVWCIITSGSTKPFVELHDLKQIRWTHTESDWDKELSRTKWSCLIVAQGEMQAAQSQLAYSLLSYEKQLNIMTKFWWWQLSERQNEIGSDEEWKSLL